MNLDLIIGAIGAQLAILLPLYFVHRQKMTQQEAAHQEKIAELEAREEMARASVSAGFQDRIFEVAKQTVDRLSMEVERLSTEVTRLHGENARLTQRVDELEAQLAQNGAPPSTGH
jgi:predicted  nucleic acid-binding Zn-ribbon protein